MSLVPESIKIEPLLSLSSEQNEQSEHPSTNKQNKCACNCFSRLCNRYENVFVWIGDVVLLIGPIGIFIFDMAFDVMLIVEYLHNGDWWYFALTFSFMAVPAIAIVIISGVNYYKRYKLKRSIEKYNDKYNLKDKFIVDSNGRFVFRFVFTTLLLSPVVR